MPVNRGGYSAALLSNVGRARTVQQSSLKAKEVRVDSYPDNRDGDYHSEQRAWHCHISLGMLPLTTPLCALLALPQWAPASGFFERDPVWQK